VPATSWTALNCPALPWPGLPHCAQNCPGLLETVWLALELHCTALHCAALTCLGLPSPALHCPLLPLTALPPAPRT
jgi:hypothetical protein